MDLKSLFREHLKERLTFAERALAITGYEEIVISSGCPYTYFADDHEAPFQVVPHFRHYCPIEGPYHVLIIRPGKRPLLIRYAPVDFWCEQEPVEGSDLWSDGFEIIEVHTQDAVWDIVGRPAKTAYIGNEANRAETAGLDSNPLPLTTYLDWGRSFKSPYEIFSLEEATKLGAKGHIASREAFLAGGSEFEIHHAFVRAVGCLDHQLAYPSIVALEPRGAILHYRNKRLCRNGKVLLLDYVMTVQPGLYFIPMLLQPFRDSKYSSRFDWKLIDELTPLGGIRFEDNVVLTETGIRNITQEYLPSWLEH